MKLMTKEIERKIPKLHEGDHTAYVKFFTPWSNWTWYGCEANALIEYEDGEQEEVGFKDVGASVCDLWNNRKSGTFSKNVSERNEMQSLCEQEDSHESKETSAPDSGKESCMERRNDGILGVHIPVDARASESDKGWLCEKSKHSLGEGNRCVPAERLCTASQGHEQAERYNRELGIDDSIRAHENAQQRERKRELQDRKVRVIDILFYGLVEGFETEWGYFSLDELESVNGPFGLKIERDLHFEPRKVGDE